MGMCKMFRMYGGFYTHYTGCAGPFEVHKGPISTSCQSQCQYLKLRDETTKHPYEIKLLEKQSGKRELSSSS